jgi:DDE superfamily endonuclease
VHCRIIEAKHPTFLKNPEYYSHKHKQAALCYEVALAVYDSRFVWISCPHKASKHDITIFQEGLKHLIPDRKHAIGDTGYKGEPTAVSTPNRAHDSPAVKKFKGRAHSRQECFNSRLKNFACLAQCFWHTQDDHKLCFVACCMILQYQMENGSPLFAV